jgi:hypothetical protein
VEACPLCRKFITARVCISDGRFVAAPARPVRAMPSRSMPASFSDVQLQPREPAFRNSSFFPSGAPGFAKPVIYLYPPGDASLDADVRVELAPTQARFTALIPTPTEGSLQTRAAAWRVRATADGTLTPLIHDAHPPVASLFWESVESMGANAVVRLLPADGAGCFCVPGAGLGDWLLRALPALGLSVREYTEMATFWAVRLGGHAYVVLRFLSTAATEAYVSTLVVQPQPQTVIRVFLLARGAAAPQPAAACGQLPDAALAPPRVGFTAVEWGGAEVLVGAA